jgi:hypothetical protein
MEGVMKKTLLVFVILCIAMVLSCGTTGGGGGGGSAPAAAAAPAGTGDLGAFRLRLMDNFQYGDGYQGLVTNKTLLNGHKIVPGETWTLKITYTTSRDLEDEVQVGFADTTPAANYWASLSWDDDKDIEMQKIPASKQGEEVSATLTFKTLRAATGSGTTANALVFLTDGEGKKGSAGSGVKKAVDLNFTEFVLTQVE